MELYKIEILIEKYFESETSREEEIELGNYFSSDDVAPHLEKYKSLFNYFASSRKVKSNRNLELRSSGSKFLWLSIAASIVVLLGIGTFFYLNNSVDSQTNDLGSYESPEVAFRETQKALNLISEHVNTGVESVQYIEQYEIAKDRIFIVD